MNQAGQVVLYDLADPEFTTPIHVFTGDRAYARFGASVVVSEITVV